jgi:hypothetical protein
MVLVYYRVYIEDEAIDSRKPAYLDDKTLGRILATSVAPPHTVKSLKRCISKVEGIDSFSKCELFLDLTSNSPLDEGPVSILSEQSIGSKPEKAIALVFSTPTEEVAPRTSLVRIISTPEPAPPPRSQTLTPVFLTRFNKKMIAIQDCGKQFWKKEVSRRLNDDSTTVFPADNSSLNPRFLNVKKNDILSTDGVARWEVFAGRGGGESIFFPHDIMVACSTQKINLPGRSAAHKFKVYDAINSVGTKGCKFLPDFKLLTVSDFSCNSISRSEKYETVYLPSQISRGL